MRQIITSILCFLSLCLQAQERDNKPVFFEKAPNDLMRFYYDKNYFLCPKDCEFKFVERLAHFDAKKSIFTGEFKDFGPLGYPLLTGNYTNGQKDGEFKAYHLNQQLKWEVTFKNNWPTGEWKYYYPDGKPFMVFQFEDGFLMLKSFWNQKGQQKIVDGNGEYDFTMHFEEFTELGFPSYRRRGKITNGLPNGVWRLFLVDGKKSTLAREEYFVNGVITDFGEVYFDIDYDEKQLQLYPIDNFSRAELLTFKNCTFDDHSGFLVFLSAALKNQFPPIKNFLIDRNNKFEYHVLLNKRGEPTKSTVLSITSPTLKPYLQNAVSRISYYLPTYSNQQYIEDELIVSGNLDVNELGEVDISGINIKRRSDQ